MKYAFAASNSSLVTARSRLADLTLPSFLALRLFKCAISASLTALVSEESSRNFWCDCEFSVSEAAVSVSNLIKSDCITYFV